MGNVVSPEDHLLHIKAWKSVTRYPVPDDYPETTLPEIQRKPSTAIAFSGGGTRAYVCTIGFLAGLRDGNLLENIRYIAGVGSSSWALSAFCYGNVKDDKILLGPVYPPELLTFENLSKMDKQCMRRLASTKIEFLFDGFITVAIDKQSAWNYTVTERFLKPVGIGDRKFFTWSKETLEDIFERNDHMVKLGLTKRDFLLPRKENGPFMVLGWSMIGPDRSWVDDKYSGKKHHFRFFDVTPMYIGQFSNEYARFNTEILNIGGVIEPFCFALQGGSAPVFGLDTDEKFGEILVPLPQKPLDLANAVSISSFNPGNVFDSYTIPFTDVYIPFTANYFSPAFEDPKMRPTLFADGGATQQIPLITFLQRGVEKIIAVSSTYTPVNYATLRDYDSPTNWIFTKQIHSSLIDVTIASFFGLTPSDLSKDPSSSEYRRNHVFATDQFADLIDGLYRSSTTGKGTIYRSKWTTVDNPYFGVDGGREVDVTFYYLETPKLWLERLPSNVRNEVIRTKGLFDGLNPEFQSFPYFNASTFQLSFKETNLLSQMVGWTVLENLDIFEDVLSNKPVDHVPSARFSEFDFKERRRSMNMNPEISSTIDLRDDCEKAHTERTLAFNRIASIRRPSQKQDDLMMTDDESAAAAELDSFTAAPDDQLFASPFEIMYNALIAPLQIFSTQVIQNSENGDVEEGVKISIKIDPSETNNDTNEEGVGTEKILPWWDLLLSPLTKLNPRQSITMGPMSSLATNYSEATPPMTPETMKQSQEEEYRIPDDDSDEEDKIAYMKKLEERGTLTRRLSNRVTKQESKSLPSIRPGMTKRQTSVIVFDDDLDDLVNTDTSQQIESLADCKAISPEHVSEMISKMASFSQNKERIEYLVAEKKPYLFTTDMLLRMLSITSSVKTRIEIVKNVGPRLIDPTERVHELLKLFRFAEDKEKVREIIRARTQTLNAHVFAKSNSLATRKNHFQSMKSLQYQKPVMMQIYTGLATVNENGDS